MDTEDAIGKILETDADTNDDEKEEEMRQEGENQFEPKSLDPGLKKYCASFSKSSGY